MLIYPLYSHRKGEAAIRCLLECFRGLGISRPRDRDLTLALYLAEGDHLLTYGRPVTGDRWLAVEHGPWPEAAGQMIECGTISFEDAVYPAPITWQRDPVTGCIDACGDVSYDALSPSDLSVLAAAAFRVHAERDSLLRQFSAAFGRDAAPVRYDALIPEDHAMREAILSDLLATAPFLHFGHVGPF